MSTDNKKKLNYVPELDGMRGFAILAVMIFHAGAPFFQGGFIGVDIFFVLSGFLITSIIISEYDDTSCLNLKNFYMRRLLRLGPALVLFLVIFTFLSFLLLDKGKSISNFVDTIISLFYMSNWARAFSIHPPDYLGHTWSLSIEEQFYFFWPITLLFLLRVFNNRWSVALVVFTIAVFSWILRVYLIQNGASYARLYNGLDTRADALMIGCVLSIVYSSGLVNEEMQKVLSKPLLLITPLVVLFFAYVSHYMVWENEQMYYWIFFILEILTAVFIFNLLVNRGTVFHKILSMNWIVWIGSISYGLYLWHYPIYRVMREYGYNWIDVVIYGSIITFIVSIISFYLLEKPILRLKKNYSGNSGVPRD